MKPTRTQMIYPMLSSQRLSLSHSPTARQSLCQTGCFVAGTLVHTRDGLKPIEQIQVGDWVLTQPENTGEQTYRRVIRTSRFEDKEVWSLVYVSMEGLRRGKDECGRLVATPNHPVWTRNRGWVALGELDRECDEVLLSNGDYAGILELSPLYRSTTEGVAWQEGMFSESRGTAIDMRHGVPDQAYEYIDEPDPEAFSFWDASCSLEKSRRKVDDSEFFTYWRIAHQGDFNLYDEAFYYRCPVYNFEVEDCHTYYVGVQGVWVHNTNNLPPHLLAEMQSLCQTGCFAAGTLVHTKEGLKPIETIKIGDWVLSQPEETGELAYKRVTRTVQHENTAVYLVSCYKKNGDKFVDQDLIVTGNHPFYVPGQYRESYDRDEVWNSLPKFTGWRRADLLSNRDLVLLANGETMCVSSVHPLWRTKQEGLGWMDLRDGDSRDTEVGCVIDLKNGNELEVAEGFDQLTRGAYYSDFMGEDDFWLRYESPEMIEKWACKCTVYTFEVEDFHTHYVGEQGVWVLNAE